MIVGEYELVYDAPKAMRTLRKAIDAGVKAAAVLLQSNIRRVLGGASPSAPGKPPGNDTGRLQGSISVMRDGPDMIVGTNLPYAETHEKGGVISGTMTVPLNPEAKMMRRRTASLRSESLTFIKRKNGSPLLAITDGGVFRPMFVLKDSVTLPPRPFLEPTFKASREGMRKAFAVAFRREAERSAIARKGD